MRIPSRYATSPTRFGPGDTSISPNWRLSAPSARRASWRNAAAGATGGSCRSRIFIIPVPATSWPEPFSRGNPMTGTPPRAPLRAPRGTQLSCRNWLSEAALRMLMNNLDPEVAERPEELVVYGGIGKAARNWECYDAIVVALKRLEADQSLLVQSGKPVGIFRTHTDAPRVLIANSNLVPAWADWAHFREYEKMGLTMYGQMTAGSWIYIGSQGILQGTYETFAAVAQRHFAGTLRGRLVVSSGLGGMGGAQPLAATLNDAIFLGIDVDQTRIDRRLQTRYLDLSTDSLDEALRLIDEARTENRAVSIGLL